MDQSRTLRYLAVFDACAYAMLEGSSADVLCQYGGRALFHLSADRRLLRCAVSNHDDPTWQRVLLDTVLWTTSLLRGLELLHASGIETASGVVAFAAASGAGKTSLAAECMRRGARLFCDDILALDDSEGPLIAHPGPPLMSVPRSTRASSLGRAQTIADFADERWLALEGSERASQPVAAIVLVERRAGSPARCAAIRATNLALLPHAVGFPHMGDRARRRFELFARLADETPVLRLSADPSLPPAALADLVESRISIR
jgi:hypothetical protein